MADNIIVVTKSNPTVTVYPASLYVPGANTVGTSQLQDNSITTAKVQSIDASKIAYNSTTLDNLAVAASGNGAALVPFLHSLTGAVARNTQDRMQDWVSALDFMTSAQIADVRAANLTVDVTAALNAAISSKPANLDVYLPPGKYLVSDQINVAGSGKRVIGAGSGSTILVSNNASKPVLSVTDGSGQITLGFMTLKHSVACTSGGDGLASKGALGLSSFFELFCESNYIGLNLGATDLTTIRNCTAQKNVQHGFNIQNPSTNGQCQWYFTECLSQMNGGSGYAMQSVAGPAQMIVGDFKSCRTYGNTGYGVLVQGISGCPVQDFKFIDGFLGGDGNDEIHLDSYGQGISIRNTFLELAGTGTTGPAGSTAASHAGNGILASANNTDVAITGCYINAMSNNGIYTSASITTVSGCHIFNNGSAAASGEQNGIHHIAGRLIVMGGAVGSASGGTTQKYAVSTYNGRNATMGFTDVTGNATSAIVASINQGYMTLFGCLPTSTATQIAAETGIAVGNPTGGVIGGGTINVSGGLLKNNSAYSNP